MSSYEGLNLPAICLGSNQVWISLREAEKFNTRTNIKKAIGAGHIRIKEDIDGTPRTRKNQSYKCLLWDVLRMADIH